MPLSEQEQASRVDALWEEKKATHTQRKDGLVMESDLIASPWGTPSWVKAGPYSAGEPVDQYWMVIFECSDSPAPAK